MSNAFDSPEIVRLFAPSERDWIEKYGSALKELISGKRRPGTVEQQHFLDAIGGLAEPRTDAERLWLRFIFVCEAHDQRGGHSALETVIEEIANRDVSALIGVLGVDLVAALDHPKLIRHCAEYFLGGQLYDPSRARPFALRAAELGDGQAAHTLGLMDEYGLCGPVDREGAMSWYKIGAERGVEESMAKVRTLVVQNPSRPLAVGTGGGRVHPSGDTDWGDNLDWGNNLDDFDARTWESILGGPDDSYFEEM
jgi:hypothetical protein